jgi:hypothetical protein
MLKSLWLSFRDVKDRRVQGYLSRRPTVWYGHAIASVGLVRQNEVHAEVVREAGSGRRRAEDAKEGSVPWRFFIFGVKSGAGRCG